MVDSGAKIGETANAWYVCADRVGVAHPLSVLFGLAYQDALDGKLGDAGRDWVWAEAQRHYPTCSGEINSERDLRSGGARSIWPHWKRCEGCCWNMRFFLAHFPAMRGGRMRGPFRRRAPMKFGGR